MAASHFAGLRHLQLALSFFAYVLVMPLFQTTWFLRVLTLALLMNAFLVTVSDDPRHALLNRAVWISFAVAAIASVVEAFAFGSATVQLGCRYVNLLGGMAVALLCAGNILTLVFRANRVTADGVFATLVVYQLVGLFFGEAYTMIALVDPTAFHWPEAPHTSGLAEHVELLYFSFVTIATLGYGDILPVSAFARGMVVIEAIAGQFYVAVVVAILVGAFFADAFNARRRASSPKHILQSDVAAHTSRQTTRRVIATRHTREPGPRRPPRKR
jgi:hypothetical protein